MQNTPRFIFLKNLFLHLASGMAAILLVQFITMVIIVLMEEQIITYFHPSNKLFPASTNSRFFVFFLSQPMLVIGLSLVYLTARILRSLGYNKIFFAVFGGLLHTALMLFLLFFVLFNAHVEIHLSLLLASLAISFVYGTFLFPKFLKEGMNDGAELKGEV